MLVKHYTIFKIYLICWVILGLYPFLVELSISCRGSHSFWETVDGLCQAAQLQAGSEKRPALLEGGILWVSHVVSCNTHLVGGLEHFFIFPYFGNFIIPTD